MTPLTPEQPALARVAPGRGARRVTTLSVGTVLAVILLLAALFAPWLAPFDPNIQHIEIRLMPPSAQHWLGTDGFGRDLLSRVIYGARPTLLLVSLILLLTIPFGLLIGISAGYLGGWVERILMRFTDIVLSLPSLVMALALVAILGPGLMNGALALAFTSWPPFARQARAETLALRRSDYLAAARAECGRSRRAEPRRDHSFLRRSWLPRDGHSAADRRVGVDGRRRQ
jgi:peptide/nickel transport system permease protein